MKGLELSKQTISLKRHCEKAISTIEAEVNQFMTDQN